MVPPGRHVGRVLRPDHDIVEVPVHPRETGVPIGEITHCQDKARASRGDDFLHAGHPDVLDGRTDVTLCIHDEIGIPMAWWGPEGMFGSIPNGVIVQGVLLKPGDFRFPERPAGRGGKRCWGDADYLVWVNAG